MQRLDHIQYTFWAIFMLIPFALHSAPVPAPKAPQGNPHHHHHRPPSAMSPYNPLTQMAIAQLNRLSDQVARNATDFARPEVRQAINQSSTQVAVTSQLYKMDAQSGQYDGSDKAAVLSKNADRMDVWKPKASLPQIVTVAATADWTPVTRTSIPSETPQPQKQNADSTELEKVRDLLVDRTPNLSPERAMALARSLRDNDANAFRQAVVIASGSPEPPVVPPASETGVPLPVDVAEKSVAPAPPTTIFEILERSGLSPNEIQSLVQKLEGLSAKLGAPVVAHAVEELARDSRGDADFVKRLSGYLDAEYAGLSPKGPPLLGDLGRSIRRELSQFLGNRLEKIRHLVEPTRIDDETLGSLFLGILTCLLIVAVLLIARSIGNSSEEDVWVQIHLVSPSATGSPAANVVSVDRKCLCIQKRARGFELFSVDSSGEWRLLGLVAPGTVASGETLNRSDRSNYYRLTPALQWVSTTDLEQYFVWPTSHPEEALRATAKTA